MSRLAFLGVILLLASCSSDEPKERERPSYVIPMDSMAKYMADLHILDAATRHREVRKLGIQAHVKQAYFEYFDTCGVTRKRFDRSLDYWSADNEEMIQVYDLTMEILSTRLADAKGKSEPEPEPEQSIDEQLEDGARVRKKRI